MRAPLFTLAALALVASAGAAQAQIKAGIQPRPMSEIRAQRAAKAEREQAKAFAEAASHGHAFDKLDKNRNGQLSFNEFKEAPLATDTPAQAGSSSRAPTATN